MSQVFTTQRKTGDAGYFRIGTEILQIPPESISTNRITAIEEIPTLRTEHPTAKRSGHSRIDITIQWQAVVDNSSGTADYSAWRQVRNILAMVKSAPFVEIYSPHVAQVLREKDSTFSDGERIAVALRPLRVETHPDIVDGLVCSLLMTVFNYKPYSEHFGYRSANNTPTDADRSGQFLSYLENWQTWNLPPETDSDFGWLAVPTDVATFNWRQYKAVALPAAPAALQAAQTTLHTAIANSPPASANLVTPAHSLSSSISGTNGTMQKVLAAANNASVDPYLALGVAQQESGFNPNARSTAGAIGVMQLMPATAAGLNVDPYNVDQNIAGGISLLSTYTNTYSGNLTKIGQAYNQGPGAAQKGLPLPAETVGWIAGVQKYMAAFKAKYPNLSTGSTIPISSNASQARMTSANLSAPAPADLGANSIVTPSQAVLQNSLGGLLQQGYLVDHYTNLSAFLYQPAVIAIGGEESRVQQHHVSVTVANNLPMIPLEGYAYPTYQHVGPASTLATLTLISESSALEGAEPSHPTAEALSRMSSTLDSQMIEMRKEFRSTASIHRMQNVLVQNRVLNLMGIRAVMIQSVDTDTVPQSPDLLQITIAGSVYANVYENVRAWRVKSITARGQQAWNNALQNTSIAQTAGSQQAQQAVQPLIDYQNNMKARNIAPLVAMLQTTNGQTYSPVPFPANMSIGPNDVTSIVGTGAGSGAQFSALDRPLTSGTPTGMAMTPTGLAATYPTFASQYPAVATRFSGTDITYSDYLLVVNTIPGSDVQAVKARIDSMVATAVANGGADPIAALYQTYFQYQYEYNPVFNTAVTEFEQNPNFKQHLRGLSQPPGQDTGNAGHGAYTDLGLLDISPQGVDQNPAYYFVDQSKTMAKYLADQATTLAGNAASAAQSLNTATGATANTINLVNLQSDLADRIKRAYVPPFSMAHAFPTFKLFLLEEDNSDIWYAYDDFYSYSAVISMEVIRYTDKPDTAVIVIGNATNLLTHKLYDNSTIGKHEQRMAAPWQRETPFSSDGSPVVTPGGATTYDAPTRLPGNVTTNIGGTNLVPGFGAQNLRSPYQYYALQTGSKIQLRMGFTSNPDMLYPVFTGKVTQIEEGEVMTLVAQGFLLELMEASEKTVPHGTQGGWTLFSNAGTAEAVMSTVIQSARNTHFGHWQINQQTSNLMRGYGYSALEKAVAQMAGYPTFATALANQYDRSDENILVNKSLNSDGTIGPVTRPWAFERSWMMIAPPSYTIPNDPQVTAWRVLRDVGRRYPECSLLVKPYGYPYGADATLVFANPNDWYLARRPLFGEDEIDTVSTTNPTQTQLFQKWWGTANDPGPGRRALVSQLTDWQDDTGNFNSVYQWYLHPNSDASGALVRGTNELTSFLDWTGVANALGVGFNSEVQSVLSNIDSGGLTAFQSFNNAVGSYVAYVKTTFIPILGPAFNRFTGELDGASKLKNIMLGLYKQMKAAMTAQANHPGSLPGYADPGDRLQPVRKWHMIGASNIVRNNLKLNDQVYNAVLVNGKIHLANGTIPEQHQRVLDCDPKILDVAHNLNTVWIENRSMAGAYAQSFLKEELGKMYRGELELTGIPEIDPGDVLALMDPTRGISGPVEVDSVIHSFTLEGGYITIVRPRALIMVNEAASAGICNALYQLVVGIPGTVSSLSTLWSGASSQHKAATVAAGAVTTAGALAAGIAVRAGLGTAATAAVEAGTAGSAVGSVVGTTAAAGVGAAGEVVGATAGFLFGGWGLAALAGVFLCYGMFTLASDQQSANPLMILPLWQYERPWVAGIDGWSITDLAYLEASKFKNFLAYEVDSTIEGFRKEKGLLDAIG